MRPMSFLVLLFVICALPSPGQQNITGTFEVDESAVNNAIAIQYLSPLFPREFSGSVGEITYHLFLGQPSVEFVPQFMRMHAHLIAQTSIGNFEWDISPSIYINNSISLTDVIGLLENFPQYVNTYLANAPQWLRDVIIQRYQDLNLIVYPGKILEFAESFVPDFLAIEVSNIGLDPIVSMEGKVSITAFLTVTGIQPWYPGYTQNRNYFKVHSNVEVHVTNVSFYNASLGITFWDWSGNVLVPKNGETVFQFHCSEQYGDDCSGQANTQSGRRIKLLLESERGRFLHIYSADYMPIDNQWRGPLAIWAGWD